VLFSTVLAHGEMLWFCRVPARAREKDAKKWKFEENLVQNVEFFIIWRFPFPDVSSLPFTLYLKNYK
jgi:hypothetical protein